MDAQVSDLLDRLQSDERIPNMTWFSWLDAHRDDAIALCNLKGPKLASELMGVPAKAMSDWRHRHGITLPTTPDCGPDLTPTGRPVNLASGKRGKKTLKVAPTVAPGQVTHSAYITGQRDAYRDILYLMLSHDKEDV